MEGKGHFEEIGRREGERMPSKKRKGICMGIWNQVGS